MRAQALLTILIGAFTLSACSGPQATAGTIELFVQVDGRRQEVGVPSGSTVQQVLDEAHIVLGDLDRVSPPGYTVVKSGTLITVVRVTERFEVQDVVISFERQTVRNESLPEGEVRLLQAGENGLEETTYRIVEEEGVEVSRSPVKRTVIQPSKPEILMVGAQNSYAPVPIQGTLAYLSGGNAWVVRTDTGQRRPLVVSGDLDGFVFRLSADGDWLLFTRHESEEDVINSLWAVSTTEEDPEPIGLGVENIVHFADWSPDTPSFTVAYSTVEPSPSPPGWQANNDLNLLTFTSTGRVVRRLSLLATNAGGQYGWWGTTFRWGPDGASIAYARADGVGTVDVASALLEPKIDIRPFRTQGDWAWVPGVDWGHAAGTLYFVNHGAPVSLEEPEASPVFDLAALSSAGGGLLTLAGRAGMFAYPAVSPAKVVPSGEASYRVAYMQAIAPLESQTSSYHLVIMDRDGSNRRVLFPAAGDPGIEPPHQAPAWSPDGERLAFVYRGDLWLVDVSTGLGQRLTTDGQTAAFDWKD